MGKKELQTKKLSFTAVVFAEPMHKKHSLAFYIAFE